MAITIFGIIPVFDALETFVPETLHILRFRISEKYTFLEKRQGRAIVKGNSLTTASFSGSSD